MVLYLFIDISTFLCCSLEWIITFSYLISVAYGEGSPSLEEEVLCVPSTL